MLNKKEKILVLGANGFIGKNMLDFIFEKDLNRDYIFYFVHKENSINYVKGIEYFAGDLLKPGILDKLFEEITPDYIINLAGILDNSNIDQCLALNAELPKKILDIIIERKISIKKILFIGSAAEYGFNVNTPLHESDTLQPITPYGLSKTIQTEYVKFYVNKFGIPVNIARTFNIIGPAMSDRLSVGSFIKQINNSKDGDTIFTGNLTSERDYLYITDVLDAYFKILLKGIPGEIYNVCSGTSISMQNILNNLINASGKDIRIEVKPDLIRPDDVPISYGNNKKIRNDVGWTPIYKLENIYQKLL